MNSRRKSVAPVVERQYLAEPGACARALQLLLERPGSKKAARPGRPDDAEGRSSDGAKGIISEPS